MDRPFELRPQDGRVFYKGDDKLDLGTIVVALNKALNKRQRVGGYAESFLYDLRCYGHAQLEWAFVRRIRKDDSHWARFTSRAHEWYYILECSGPRAQEAIDAINDKLAAPRKRNKRERTQEHHVKRQRRHEKRRRQRHQREVKAPVQEKKKRIPNAAPLSLKTKDKVVWQYHHNLVTWKEAVALMTSVFGGQDRRKQRAAQLAADELFCSFDSSGHRFMRMKRGGFEVRFDILQQKVDNDWIFGPEQEDFFDVLPARAKKRKRESIWDRLEYTRFTISCTKDNENPDYKRMRKLLHARLQGLSWQKARERRIMLSDAPEQLAA